MGQTRWEPTTIQQGTSYTIDSVADSGGGVPRFHTSVAHDLEVNDVVRITGLHVPTWDGVAIVTAVAAQTFDIGADTFYGIALAARGVQGSTAAAHLGAVDVFKLVDTTRTLYAAVDDVTLVFPVDDTTGISPADRITLNNEELLVNAVDAGVGGAVVVRGVQGSVAATHAAAAAVAKLVDTTRTLYHAADNAALKFAVSSSTGISVADNVTIGNEQLLVDTVDTTVGGCLVARGANSSVAAVHAADAVVSKNVSASTLDGAIVDAGATTFKVADVLSLSDGDVAIIDGEQIHVITMNIDTLTVDVCVRGYNGTVAATHLTAAAVGKLTAIAACTLYTSVLAADTSIAFSTLAGWADGDTLVVGAEQISATTQAAAVDGFTVLARGANSTTAASHVGGTAIFLVTDTTDTLYVACSAATTKLAFSAIAGFANADTLLVGAERITCTTKDATVNGISVLARGYNSSTAAAHVIATAIFLVTDTTDNVSALTWAAIDTYLTFSAIAGFANGDTLVVGAERISVMTKSPAEAATVAQGLAVSDVVELQSGERIIAIETPSVWNATADLCFQTSRDGTTFLDVMDKAGAIIRVTNVAVSELRVLTNKNYGLDFPAGKLKVRSVNATPTSADVNQTDAPVFYLLLSKG